LRAMLSFHVIVWLRVDHVIFLLEVFFKNDKRARIIFETAILAWGSRGQVTNMEKFVNMSYDYFAPLFQCYNAARILLY
jgi:hypothetical protein